MSSILAGFFAIGVLVVVHEAGHFLVAKAFGVGVPVFSVGVGPRLFGITWRGTDYRLSALPFGGYVQITGMDMFAEDGEFIDVPASENIQRRPVYQRIAILAAGPLVNLALPFVLFTAVLMLGEPQLANYVGEVVTGTTAEEVGFEPGDHIVAIDDQGIQVWVDMVEYFEAESESNSSHVFTLERDGQQLDVTVPAGVISMTRRGLDTDTLGIHPSAISARIGVEDPNSPAAKSGLKLGDTIRSVNGEVVTDWRSLMAALASGDRHELLLERSGTAFEDSQSGPIEIELVADVDFESSDGMYANRWGLVPVMLFAQEVKEDSPASRAGVQIGDRFFSVDGEPVRTFDNFIHQVSAAGEGLGPGEQPRSLDLAVIRAGEFVEMELTPEVLVVVGEAYSRPIIGVMSFASQWRSPETVRKYYSLAAASSRATRESIAVVKAVGAILGNMLTGRAKASENVGGPVAIVQQAGAFADAGVFAYMRFIGMISVSLGIINLLPVPVLDGGNITISLIEAIRGRALSLEIRERIQMIGVLGLVVLMLLVTVNDVGRWVAGP